MSLQEVDLVAELCNTTPYAEVDVDSLYDEFSYVLNGVLMTSMICLGITGNCLTCYMLSLSNMRTSINGYFVALAFWDTLLLISSFFIFALGALQYGDNPTVGNFVYLYLPFFPVGHMAKMGSIWTLIATTAERYYAVCQPLQSRKYDTERRVLVVVAAVAMSSIVLNTCRFFELKLVYCADSAMPVILPSALRLDPVYHMVCNFLFGLLLNSLGPFLVLFVLILLTFVHLRHSKREARGSLKRRDAEDCSRLQASMERKLVVVGLKFVVCMIFPTAVDVYEVLMTTESAAYATGVTQYLVSISNFLVVTNSAVNFPIYLLCGWRFRQEFVRRMSRTGLGVGLERSNSGRVLPLHFDRRFSSRRRSDMADRTDSIIAVQLDGKTTTSVVLSEENRSTQNGSL